MRAARVTPEEVSLSYRLRNRNPTPVSDFFSMVRAIPGGIEYLQKEAIIRLGDHFLADGKISEDTNLKVKLRLNLEYLDDLLSSGVISDGVYQLRKVEMNLRYDPSFKAMFGEIREIAEELGRYAKSP